MVHFCFRVCVRLNEMTKSVDERDRERIDKRDIERLELLKTIGTLVGGLLEDACRKHQLSALHF